MNKRFALVLALLLAVGFVLAAGEPGTWTGVITDDHCGYKASHTAACVNKCVSDHGAKYALVNLADKKVYVLEPQDKAAPLANENVKVTGTLNGNTIQIKTIDKVGK
jgi:hypothetical protein